MNDTHRDRLTGEKFYGNLQAGLDSLNWLFQLFNQGYPCYICSIPHPMFGLICLPGIVICICLVHILSSALDFSSLLTNSTLKILHFF